MVWVIRAARGQGFLVRRVNAVTGERQELGVAPAGASVSGLIGAIAGVARPGDVIATGRQEFFVVLAAAAE